MKYTEIDRGYGIEVKITGNVSLLLELAGKLRSSGYNVGEMISDFRPSYLHTDAPLQAVKQTK